MSIYNEKYAMPVLEVFQNLSHQTISVGTTAVKLPEEELEDRKSIIIYNKSESSVWLGSATVTADDEPTGGYELQKEKEFRINLNNHDIYAISTEGDGVPIAIIELG